MSCLLRVVEGVRRVTVPCYFSLVIDLQVR